jgi:hypothetical protein
VIVSRPLPLEAGDLPDESPVCHDGAEASLLEDREQRWWWVDEGSELLAEGTGEEVRAGDEQAREGIPPRVAEDHEPPRVLRRRCEQPSVVGVTADNAVEHDDIGGLDRVSVGGDVVEAPGHALLEPVLAEQAPPLLLVRRRKLEVEHAGGAALQQLEPDPAHTAADLENRRALDPAGVEEGDHSPRRLVEAFLPIPLRDAAREPLAEHLVASAGAAATRHEGKCRRHPLHGAPTGDGGSCLGRSASRDADPGEAPFAGTADRGSALEPRSAVYTSTKPCRQLG